MHYITNVDYWQVSWILDSLHERCERSHHDEQIEFILTSQETTPWAGFRSMLMSGGCLFLSSDRVASWHVMLVFDMLPHAFSLSFYMEAVFDATQECQLQVVADVIVHGHVVANYINAQRAITFADGFLFISCITRGDLGDRIMGEKAAESHHNLGVISIYVIRRDEFFHLRCPEDLHHVQGQGTAFPHDHA